MEADPGPNDYIDTQFVETCQNLPPFPNDDMSLLLCLQEQQKTTNMDVVTTQSYYKEQKM